MFLNLYTCINHAYKKYYLHVFTLSVYAVRSTACLSSDTTSVVVLAACTMSTSPPRASRLLSGRLRTHTLIRSSCNLPDPGRDFGRAPDAPPN